MATTTSLRSAALAASLFACAAFARTDPAPTQAGCAHCAAAPQSQGAQALKSRYEELRDKLEHNAFQRPLHLAASESGRDQKGEVYGVVEHPFTQVQRGLRDASSWCDVLILPYNTKHCHADGRGGATTLTVRIGRKADQPAEDAYPIAFKYALAAESPDYMRVVLQAPDGPLGTRDYRIALEATPIDERRTFIHLSYAYGFSAVSRFAMQAYLSTAGAHKVGFTVVGRESDGSPRYIGGMLGATERNTMRYFLAIDAYLASLTVPEGQRLDKRLNDWYAASLRYPRQLHELDRGEYFAMKHREARRLSEAL